MGTKIALTRKARTTEVRLTLDQYTPYDVMMIEAVAIVFDITKDLTVCPNTLALQLLFIG